MSTSAAAGGGEQGRVIVFAGPCLLDGQADRWRPLLDGFDLRPPAKRGDVLAALSDQPSTILLLDGYYYTVPAVTHKELLYALDSGVRVIGAASMGALRAAEMAPFGMEGVGRVYRWFRDGELDGDDEVALLHATADFGYRPHTHALVEVRHAVERLARRHPLRWVRGERLLAALKQLAFQDRTPERLRVLARRHLGDRSAAELELLLASESVKSDDACEALSCARQPSPPRRWRDPEAGGYLSSFKEGHLRGPTPETEGPGPLLLHAARLIQVLHPAAPAFIEARRRCCLRAAAAREADLEVSPEREAFWLDRLRDRHARLFGDPILPAAEYRLEADLQARAEAAASDPRRQADALERLAGRQGLLTVDEGRLLELVAGQTDLLPTWWIARSLSFTAAMAPALAAAAIVEEIHDCFRELSGGRRRHGDDLRALAHELWGAEGEVGALGRLRGLLATSGLSSGLFEALELVDLGRRFSDGRRFEVVCEEIVTAPLDYPFPSPTIFERTHAAVEGEGAAP